MPTYFFYVRAPTDIAERQQELPDRDAAWQTASVLAGQVLRLKPGQAFETEVTDDLRHRLYIISITCHEYAEASPPQDTVDRFHLPEGPPTAP